MESASILYKVLRFLMPKMHSHGRNTAGEHRMIRGDIVATPRVVIYSDNAARIASAKTKIAGLADGLIILCLFPGAELGCKLLENPVRRRPLES